MGKIWPVAGQSGADGDEDEDEEGHSFGGPPERLSSLFGDPDARGHRRWRDMFGISKVREANAEEIDDLIAAFMRLH